MIHIVTVHWKDDRWVDVQLKYLNEFIDEPFRMYTYLNYLPVDHSAKFFYSSTDDIQSHALKLNLLAEEVSKSADDENDMIIFIDGDAFPIAPVAAYCRQELQKFPLIAIQRKENVGDIQPHPSFAATAIKFWKEIKGDWQAGYRWPNNMGGTTSDVGGNLLEILERDNIAWKPLLRSNRFNEHALWFGIYENLIYHHGAGFRDPISRHDFKDYISDKTIPKEVKEEMHKDVIKRNKILDQKVYRMIEEDFNFFKYFQ